MRRKEEPERIGNILRDFLEADGLASTLKHLEIYSAWEEVAGPCIVPHTRVAGFKGHKLYVDVDSAAHMQELRIFRRPEILQGLREKLPSILIEDIVFRPAPLGRC